MPNVLSTLKRPVVHLVPRFTLILRRNKHLLSLTQASAATVVALDGSTIVPTSQSMNVVSPGVVSHDSQESESAKRIGKDVLLLGLDALAQSADAFPPLKSAVCGLLFLTTQADVSHIIFAHLHISPNEPCS